MSHFSLLELFLSLNHSSVADQYFSIKRSNRTSTCDMCIDVLVTTQEMGGLCTLLSKDYGTCYIILIADFKG